MRRILPPLIFMALLLTGCGTSSGADIPEGLNWTAQGLQSQETGEILAAVSGSSAGQAVPALDITAQVEGGTVTLTDHRSGETCVGTLTLMEGTDPGDEIYTLVLPGVPEGYGVYGVTEYAGGHREATLYLTAEGRSLRLTAPLSEQ